MPLRPQTLYPAHAKQHPAVNGGNVAILSADNPRFAASLQGEQALRDELDRLGLDYEVTKGRYGAPERSFIVMNPELPAVLDLARRAGQESVAYSENGRHQLHFVNGPQAGMATNPSERHQWNAEEPQDNYTAVPSPTGEPWGYFTWDIDQDSPLVPSKPTPMTQAQVAPMAKSEAPLVASIRSALEALGELRTRELAKAEQPKPGSGVAVAPGVRIKPQVAAALANVKRKTAPAGAAPAKAVAPPAPGPKNTQAPATANMSGRASVLGMKKAEGSAVKPTDPDAYFHPSEKGSPSKPPPAGPPAQNTYRNVPRDYKKGEGSQVNIETNPFKKPDWKPIGTALKSEYDPGSAVSMVQGDMTHVKSTHGVKKSDAEHVKQVRDAEDRELASIPVRDTSKPRTQQSGKVPSIAEEKQMGKSETSKVDPLDGDISKQKHMCKMCKTEMSPVVAALRSKKGGVCVKCGSKMEKGELKYHNNEPHYQDHLWKPECKEVSAPGSGGQVTKNPVGTSSNPGAASATFPMKKAEGMPVPSAPKPPQAPGAKPAMPGQMAKGEDDTKTVTMRCRCGATATAPRVSGGHNAVMAKDVPKGWTVKKGSGWCCPEHSGLKKAEEPAPTPKEQGEHGFSPKRPVTRKAQCECGKPGCMWCNPKSVKKAELAHMNLHKAIRETIDLRKAYYDETQKRGGVEFYNSDVPGAPRDAGLAATALMGQGPTNPRHAAIAMEAPQDPGPAPQARTAGQIAQNIHAEPEMQPDPEGYGGSCTTCGKEIAEGEPRYMEGYEDDPDMTLCANCAPARIAEHEKAGLREHLAKRKAFKEHAASHAALGNEVDQAVEGAQAEGQMLKKEADLKKALFTGGGRLHVSSADPRVKAAARAASAPAPGAPTGIPPAGKVQPKSPAEYDAAAFRPASPGAAGAPSGLELDTAPKKFAPGFKPTFPPTAKGGPGMAPPPLPTKPTLKQGLPIAKLTGIRGAPLSKPKV